MGLVEELLLSLALGVVMLVHARLAASALLAAREDDDPVLALSHIITAIVLMIDPIIYAIAMR